MKILLFFVLNTISCLLVQAQDGLWMMGYQCCQPGFGGTNLNFDGLGVTISSESRQMYFASTNAVITSETGQILFYTNGMYVANANNDTMLNGSELCSDPSSLSCGRYGLAIPQGALILPFGNNSSNYYLFHEEYDINDSLSRPNRLMLSVIDMTLDSGLGGVTVKCSPFLNDRLVGGCITACRHANGRDWWVIVQRSLSNLYYKLLVTPDGITVSTQNIGNVPTASSYVGQSCFSPDGNQYAHFDQVNGLDLFEFDRCTGLLSNPRSISQQILGATSISAGVAFSPNSRLLYLSYHTKLFQADTYSSNLVSSLQLVGFYDGFTSPFPATFYTAQLAKDNKIYLTANNGINYLHVINHPDSLGLACDFQQHSLSLPTYNGCTIGTPANFRLMNEPGTICDSLSSTDIGNPKPEVNFNIFPNPTTGFIKVSASSSTEISCIKVFDMTGRELISKKYNDLEVALNINDFPVGVYSLKIKCGDRYYDRKVVKQ